MSDYEFYETPETFTRYLFREVPVGGALFEPCAGAGAIIRASAENPCAMRWLRNDFDRRWPAEWHLDARDPGLWNLVGGEGDIHWTVTNPPFTTAIDILEQALEYSTVGVVMHLRNSIHEVLKTGKRRTFMVKHLPTGILFLPRFAYQRSRKTGKWTTDSVGACWVIWLKDRAAPQFIRYAPGWVLNELDRETPAYRDRIDVLMQRIAAA